MGMNRRTFLTGSGVLAASALMGRSVEVLGGEPDSADLLLTNGVIVTMSENSPVASSMAVKEGKILAVGHREQVASYQGTSTRVIDLQGKGVSPGLIDGHSHLVGFGQMQRMFVIIRPPEVVSFESLKRVLAAAATQKPEGEWIVARGFQDFKEGRFPTRQDLDGMVPNHPLLIIHWGGQFGAANTLALEKADLMRRDAKDPYGGKYLREKRTGLPNGILIHYPAIYGVHKPLLDEEEQMKCGRWAVEEYAKQGVTCVHDNFIEPKTARTYVRLERLGRLPLRIRVYSYVWNLEQAKRLAKEVQRYQGPLVRFQGIKLAVDGYAMMYEIPEEHKHLFLPMHPRNVFEEIIAVIHRADLQADVHAVGDKGVDWTLAAYANAAGSPHKVHERRHRIEHFPFRKTDSIKQAADMGVPVCTQPALIRVRAEELLNKMKFSRELVRTMTPIRTFLREGVRVAFGADVPAFPSHSPMESIRCSMERITSGGAQLDTEEAITFLEALKIHTIGGAYASFDEGELGSLEPGKRADFVIWNKDLHAVRNTEDLKDLTVLATYVGGRQVYRAEAAMDI